MKVLHINTKDTGGAAVACIRLHISLLQIGVNSKLLTKKKTRTDIKEHYSFEEEFNPSLGKKARLISKKLKSKARKEKEAKFLRSIDKSNGPFSFIKTDNPVESLSLFKEADIIHLHWVTNFINWETFFPACKGKKIIWTLHDMFPFTGGYHYANEYEGFKRQDEDYPMLKNSCDPQMAKKILAQKNDILKKSSADLTVVAPSQWLCKCSQESSLFGKYNHHCIPYGLNTDNFNYNNQYCCRQVLGLPQNKKIVLFISQNVMVKRKGFHILKESLKYFEEKNTILLCSVGKSDPVLAGENHISFGSVNEDRYLSLIYNAADVFVIPTLEDNLPNVVLESLSCGTPVIGFSVGGIKDMVKPGFNGTIASDTSAISLYKTISDFFAKNDSFDRVKIREDAVYRYALSVQASAYHQLYQNEIIQK